LHVEQNVQGKKFSSLVNLVCHGRRSRSSARCTFSCSLFRRTIYPRKPCFIMSKTSEFGIRPRHTRDYHPWWLVRIALFCYVAIIVPISCHFRIQIVQSQTDFMRPISVWVLSTNQKARRHCRLLRCRHFVIV